jgi:molybdopterin converting factor small subunit
MPEITLRLFGFGTRASDFDTERRSVAAGTTVHKLWESLRASADDNELLARIDERNVVFLLNGTLIHQHKTNRTTLKDGDTVTYMVLAMGGQRYSQEGGDGWGS